MAKLKRPTLLKAAVLVAQPLFGWGCLRGDVTLTDAAPAAPAAKGKPVWVQIACTGKWMGHPNHPDGVEFTRAMFDQVITNFRANPNFEVGPDGVGAKPVIPFDYEHASEMPPTSGSVPQKGAPAPAWALDLRIQASEDGETDELWALTKFGPVAREQIANDEYRWTSVSIWKSARDSATNQPIGAVLTSVALTNHPFIQGMEPLAIAARARVNASVSVYGNAESPEQAIVGMRDIFGLPPDATVEQIAAQFARLREVLAAPPAQGEENELYENAEMIARRLRELLGVPTLSTIDEVVAAGGQILAAMSLVQPSAPAATGEPSMTTPAMTTAFPLHGKLTTLYKLREGSNDAVIFAAAEKSVEAATESTGALEKLQALFGSDDTQALLVAAKKAIDDAEKSKDLVSALQAANERIAGFDKEKAGAEVEAVAASMGLSQEQYARMQPLLLAERAAVAADPVKLADWRKKNLPDAQQQLLTSSIVAGPNGSQYGGAYTGLPNQQVQLTAPNGGRPPVQAPQRHPLETYPGANNTQKAMAYLSDKRPGFVKLQRIDQVRAAGQYLTEGAPVL